MSPNPNLNRFLYEKPLHTGSRIQLSHSDAHHFTNVLRGSLGEIIELSNGQGATARARVSEISANGCFCEILDVTQFAGVSRVSLAFGIPKGPALDFIFHRCTEMGVGEFFPLLTQHSLHPDSWNEERWQRVVRETSKQCQTAFIPKIHPPVSFNQFVEAHKANTLIFFDETRRDAEPNSPPATGPIHILVGPEGGWSAAETALAREKGATFCGLGETRLRADTASLVAVAMVRSAAGEIPKFRQLP